MARISTSLVAWAARLWDKYEITPKTFAAMMKAQGGKCAVCRRPPVKYRLNVDHDHRSRVVRGLLCFECNKRVVGRHHNGAILRRASTFVDFGIDWRHPTPEQIEAYTRFCREEIQ